MPLFCPNNAVVSLKQCGCFTKTMALFEIFIKDNFIET
jgi:hypothetical protein